MLRFRLPAALATLALLTTCGRDGPDHAKTVIMISIDSLRADRLGCYGLDRETSPMLDRLAREGARFSCVSSTTSWTLPSHAALFTGLPDRVHNCYRDTDWLDGTRETVAEAFKRAGYRTAGFFSGPYLHPGFGLAQGFDEYHDCTSYSKKTIDALRRNEVPQDWMVDSHHDVTNEIVLREVTEWLARSSDGPRFAFIHLWDVHYDYIAPESYRTRFTDPDYHGPAKGGDVLSVRRRPAAWKDTDVAQFIGLYDAEIRWTDDTIAKLLAAFEASGSAPDDTVVCVTSDHGEAFYEHDIHGHRYSLYEEEVRIPWILHAPGRVPAGTVVDRPASLVDVAPTLLAVAGLEALPHAWGRSFAPLLADPRADWTDVDVITELVLPERHQFALRTPMWKMIVNVATGTTEVYDLVRDPDERAPLEPAAYPLPPDALNDRYVKLAQRLDQAFQRIPRAGERDTPKIDRMTEEQLRTLGYLK